MSGGGGSPDPFPGPDVLGRLGGGGPAGGDASPDPCLELRFKARLRSVDPAELELVDVGDTLRVRLFTADRPQIGVFRIIGPDPLVTADSPVGVLLDRIAELLPCLSGFTYDAEVLAIDGGDVTVHVHVSVPASS
jgi:hypothetical protein